MSEKDIYFWLGGQEDNIYLETIQRGKAYRLKWYRNTASLSHCLFYGLASVFRLEFAKDNTCIIRPK